MADNYCSKCGNRLEPTDRACRKCGQSLTKGLSPWLILAIVLGGLFVISLPVIAIMAAILIPNFIRARAQGQFIACKSNCRNIGTALEMYSSDFEVYPSAMKKLVPKYLRTMPTCPASGSDTYSSSYLVRMNRDGKGGDYIFFCSGSNHSAVGAPPNFPQYQSTTGLIDGRSNYSSRDGAAYPGGLRAPPRAAPDIR